MRKIKYLLLILILFLSIGFAAISTNLGINSTTAVTMADFDVYFSDVRVNGVQDTSIVRSSTEIRFMPAFLNGSYVVDYSVTNSSRNYDADVSVNCVGSSISNSIELVNEFDSSTILEASETRNGKISMNSDYNSNWICIDSDNSGDISKGDEIVLESSNNERFNVISDTDDTITALAKFSLDSSFLQSVNAPNVSFADSNGWEYTPGPKEIDIQQHDGNVKTYVNEYVSYLQAKTGDSTITGNLITLAELGDLECSYPSNYGYESVAENRTCTLSSYSDWLINGQRWWTRSAYAEDPNDIWCVYANGEMDDNACSSDSSVRPTITLSKSDITIVDLVITCTIESSPLENYVLGEDSVPDALEPSPVWLYSDSDSDGVVSLGDEYTLFGNQNEQFNVISIEDDSVTLLAKYNLDSSYHQTQDENYVSFSNSNGWISTPGPLEVDIQEFDGNSKKYVNKYVQYLKILTDDNTIKGDLITMKQLGSLDCIYNTNYYYEEDISLRTCANSKYKNWLLNNQYAWTKSIQTDDAVGIWTLHDDGELDDHTYSKTYGIRPVIIVSKDALNNKPVDISISYEVGTEIDIEGFKYNVIDSDTSTIKLLAKESVGNTVIYRDCTDGDTVCYGPFPSYDIDFDDPIFNSGVKSSLDEHGELLKEKTGDDSISVTLITLGELRSLGCTGINDDYSVENATCKYSDHASWLIENRSNPWWTRSHSDDGEGVYVINNTYISMWSTEDYAYIYPVVTISKDTYDKYYLN